MYCLYRQCVWLWGGDVELCCRPYSAGVSHILARFRTYKIATPPKTKMTSKDDNKGFVSLKFLRLWYDSKKVFVQVYNPYITLCVNHRLNMALDLQSLFGLFSLAETPQLPLPPHLGSYMRALLVSQERRHLFLTLGVKPSIDVWTNLCNLSHGSEMKNETGCNF